MDLGKRKKVKNLFSNLSITGVSARRKIHNHKFSSHSTMEVSVRKRLRSQHSNLLTMEVSGRRKLKRSPSLSTMAALVKIPKRRMESPTPSFRLSQLLTTVDSVKRSFQCQPRERLKTSQCPHLKKPYSTLTLNSKLLY